MVEAKIITDSVAPSGIRLTTFLLTYPRMVHAEFLTHRVFSRNASSSRAIPVNKQIQMVLDNPAIPLAFTKNKPGMQGGEALKGNEHEEALKVWLQARDHAVEQARKMVDLEVHKQYANRILEPWQHITVVCSATEFSNFFALRYHSMAQPEICELAKQMWELYSANEPEQLKEGEWHLPFVGVIERTNENCIKSSVARCARVSYLNHEGKTPTLEEDLKLYGRLLGGTPIHASPAEHQARAEKFSELRSGNFIGWTQYRKTLENENIVKFTGPASD